MFEDHAAFGIHLGAFKTAFTGYIATSRDHSETTRVISHRLKTWEALDAYRKGMDPLRQRLMRIQPHLQGASFEPTYVHASLSW
jgi:hypothetical protein